MNHFRQLDPASDTLKPGDEFRIPNEMPEQWYLLRSLAEGETFKGDLIYRRIEPMSNEPKRTWSDEHTARVIAGQVKEIDRLQALIAEQRAELGRRRKQGTEDAEWLTKLREQLEAEQARAKPTGSVGFLEARITEFCNDSANAFDHAALLKVGIERGDALLVVVAHVLCSALLKFNRIPGRPGQS